MKEAPFVEDRKTSPAYRVVRWLVWLFYPRIEVVGQENLPDGPCVVVGNHTQMNGPIACELYFPGRHYIWCAAEMMTLREVPAYAFTDFWSFKPKTVRWFYRGLSYLIAPLSVLVFNNAHTIPVYRDMRTLSTIRDSIAKLQAGARVIIFPEYNKKYNHILYDFQDRFVDTARFYHRKTGEALSFVPLYIAPKLKKMFIGKPVRFDPSAPIESERRRICDALMADITAMAEALPRHTVIPYRNTPKRDYPTNIPEEKKAR